jgi:hypothetical protein
MNLPGIGRNPRVRRGIALGIVLLVGIAVLVLGIAMITTSGGQLRGGVDTKQRIKARIAAETQANLLIAFAVDQATTLFGTNMTLSGTSLAALPTGDGLEGMTTVDMIGNGSTQVQEAITAGDFKGMRGYKQAYVIHSTGVAPGGAKSKIDAQIKIYQVPVFQFGVFYEGDLEMGAGSAMFVGGPVHTNGNAYFRSPNNALAPLEIQGPVTVTGTLYHWQGNASSIRYRVVPEATDFVSPVLTTNIQAAVLGTVPLPNVQWGTDRISIPIGGATPRSILLPKSGTDPALLAKQKFDSRIACSPVCPPARWVNAAVTPALPAWITGPRVFFDRREQAWVKYWNVDITKLPTTGEDSIFYLADQVQMAADRGTLGKPVINAFRIVKASMLPRNLTIATPNPVYLVGDFNVPNAASTCAPAGVAAPTLAQKYCNAMIASDALTLLSTKWLTATGALDQPFSNAVWATAGSPETSFIKPDSFNGTITVNAAIMTGNKKSNPAAYPPGNVNNGVFESNYEGGWQNTIRFLENLYPNPGWPQPAQATVNFNGSFICLWEAASPGLNTNINTKVIQTLDFTTSKGYYSPPVRNWSYDPRFKDLANMPPATPFLNTPPLTAWSELR